MNIDNAIEIAHRDLINYRNDAELKEYINLYSDIDHSKLKEVFATLHKNLVCLFKCMNKRLPTEETTTHFWAEPSRDLITIIDILLQLKGNLKDTEYSFDIEAYYERIILNSKKFLKKSYGSEISIGLEKINLYYKIPIFSLSSNIKVNRNKETFAYKTQLIGSGSYADVYKYKDLFYNKIFALKKLKKNLSQKEQERFKKEYETMWRLRSPYIIEVYNYNEQECQYVMEFADYTLKDYINENNGRLGQKDRKKLILQVLKAFEYLHSKNILHRDISYTNILIKKYEDVNVVKLSDFGLVKNIESSLTSTRTEVKGALNDPELVKIGFYNYKMCHEIYALTQIIFFIMTGKTNMEKANEIEEELIDIGMNMDIAKRFKDIEEMKLFIKNKYIVN